MLAVNVQMLACMNSELHWNSDGKLVVSFIFLRIAGYDVFLVLSDSIKGLWKAIMVNLSIFLYYLFWWFIQVVVLNNMNGEGVMELIVQVGSDAIVIALYFTHHVLVIKYWSSPERVPWKVVPLKHPWRVKHIIINRTWCMNSLLFTIPSYLVLTPSHGKGWWVIWGNSVFCHSGTLSSPGALVLSIFLLNLLLVLPHVTTAAAMCSHHWPPQLFPLPLGHLACGSLSTFTEHKLCRRQQRLASRSPVAPKIGEIHTYCFKKGGEGTGGLFTGGNRQFSWGQVTRMSVISCWSLQQW